MKSLLISICLFLFFSCSPEKRLYNLLKKHPELSRHDTVWQKLTIKIPGAKADTVFKNQITRDTIVIRDKQLTIKYYNDGKTTYLKGVCDTITVYKEVPVSTTTINPVKEVKVYPWWAWLSAGIAVWYIGLVALKFRK